MKSDFVNRHIGPNDSDISKMLESLGCENLDHFIKKVIPERILLNEGLQLPPALTETQFLARAKSLAKKNKVFQSFLGQGFYGTETPGVILRNILENPAWYTAYTPYQAEISQGRMEALLNFQTMIKDLTALDIANASLLDEGTACAEAMVMAYHKYREKRHKIFVDEALFTTSKEVLKTRAFPLNIEIIEGSFKTIDLDDSFFAALVQYPNQYGEICDYEGFFSKAKNSGVICIAACDLLSLCLLKPPGEWGADVAVGSSQRFGVPMGFGGPHAGYMACREEYKRIMPGRLIGISKDKHNRKALRLALQTREQHIRREKATSNICTAQVLLAVMASMYAIYHGPKGLKKKAQKILEKTALLKQTLEKQGYTLSNTFHFDTLTLTLSPQQIQELKSKAESQNINLFYRNESISLSLDETTLWEDVKKLALLFGSIPNELLPIYAKTESVHTADSIELNLNPIDLWPERLLRTSSFLDHPTFNSYHSETEMLRYIFRLQSKDLSLVHAMIPLGSCTMKLNATSEMIPVTWPEFGNIHPFAPQDQVQGYMELIHELENSLAEITGFAGISLQPNAGSQGEYTGLLAIQKYHQEQGNSQRKICLIPSSAHGTNPASAVMAGMEVVVVKCDTQGNIDTQDLKAKAQLYKDQLAAFMMTYPSTHGVFEEEVSEICEAIHDNGGQVYMDGANMNAMVGLAKPGKMGPDVIHLNLHKTFCIPHGGGGPGIGPIGVASHLKEYLPGHSQQKNCGGEKALSATTSSPWGSASILPISWGYISMMGATGLKKASQIAILNANYVAKKLEKHYPILYKGKQGYVAHECIIDVRSFKDELGITVDDFAKRLMDYGFHAPTMSWPVIGTLMFEPTESESKEELDRFIEAMIEIKNELNEIAKSLTEGNSVKENNVLVNAPHSIYEITATEWPHPYSREKAAFPLPWVKEHKFWTPVSRVDNAYGDRNLFCECPPIESYSTPV